MSVNMTEEERALWRACFAARCARQDFNGPQDVAFAANHASETLSRVNGVLDTGHPAIDAVALGELEAVMGAQTAPPTKVQISGARLAYARTTQGYTLRQVANLLGATVELVQSYERGNPKLPEILVESLANLFGVDAAYLMHVDAPPSADALRDAIARASRSAKSK